MFRLHANKPTHPMRLRFIETPPEGGSGGGAEGENTEQNAESGAEQDGEKPNDDEKRGEEPQEGSKDAENGFDELPEWAQSEIRRLRQEAGGFRTKLREAQEALTNAKSPEDIEKAVSEAVASVNAQLADAERRYIGAKHQLPDELASRIQGSTPEEMEADAKKLAKLLGSEADPELSGGLTPGSSDEVFDPVAEAKRVRASRY